MDPQDDDNDVYVFQILLRLPVRSLLRFRCVCKEWCELIDSGVFKDMYLALRRAMAVDDQLLVLNTPVNPYYDDPGRISPVPITCWYGDYQSLALYASDPSSGNDFVISDNYSTIIKIMNHVDGIVCFIDEGDTWVSNREKKILGDNWQSSDWRSNNWLDLTLVNPALREIRKLPIPEFDVLGEIYKRYVQGVGFGYVDDDDDDDDSSNNEYKVVAIVTVFEDENYCFDDTHQHIGIVYHLSTNCWTLLGDMSPHLFRHFPYQRSVFSHGALHWCTVDHGVFDDDDDDDNTKYKILALDLTSDSFRQIPFPRGYRYYDPYELDPPVPKLFAVDKSTIALVASTFQCYVDPVAQVWVMKEYGEADSWTKRCSIRYFVDPICFWEKDKIILESHVAGFICYHLSQPVEEEEPVADEPCLPPCCISSGIPRGGLRLVPGHESFVSVNM